MFSMSLRQHLAIYNAVYLVSATSLGSKNSKLSCPQQYPPCSRRRRCARRMRRRSWRCFSPTTSTSVTSTSRGPSATSCSRTVPDKIVLGFFKTEIGDFSKADCLRIFSTLDFSRRIFFAVFSPTFGDLQCGLPCVNDIYQFKNHQNYRVRNNRCNT